MKRPSWSPLNWDLASNPWSANIPFIFVTLPVFQRKVAAGEGGSIEHVRHVRNGRHVPSG